MQFVLFEMFTSAHLYQIAQEIMSLLINKLYEKMITEGQDRWNFDSMHALLHALLHSLL